MILCCSLGLTPSVDVFLYFFEVKDPGKKLWVSLNGVAGRVLLTLFQHSYKGFKKNFFKVRCNHRDPSLLDGFPLYWTEKPNLRRVRHFEDLSVLERGVCELLSRFVAPLSTLELLKREYRPEDLDSYIGTSPFCSSSSSICVSFAFMLTCFYCIGMHLNEDKKRKLADLLVKQRAVAAGTSLSVPLALSSSTVPATKPMNLAPAASKLRGGAGG